MESALLPCVEIDPPGEVRSAVIWLHGLGADGHDFEPVVPLLGLEAEQGVRFVFPHAPRIPVSINMGMVMPAWYDISEDDLRGSHNEDGIRAAVPAIHALMERERERGLTWDRILLAGFSQGGALALHTALRFPEKLAGVMGLSTWLVGAQSLDDEGSPANARLPVFLAHGLYDPMVPVLGGRHAREILEARGHPVAWHEYPMEHQVCPQELEQIGAWLRERL